MTISFGSIAKNGSIRNTFDLTDFASLDELEDVVAANKPAVKANSKKWGKKKR